MFDRINTCVYFDTVCAGLWLFQGYAYYRDHGLSCWSLLQGWGFWGQREGILPIIQHPGEFKWQLSLSRWWLKGKWNFLVHRERIQKFLWLLLMTSSKCKWVRKSISNFSKTTYESGHGRVLGKWRMIFIFVVVVFQTLEISIRHNPEL